MNTKQPFSSSVLSEMGRFATASTTGRAFIDGDWSESVKKRVYLPEVDEFRSSSGPLSGELEQRMHEYAKDSVI